MAVAERHVDVLAFACLPSCDQGGHDRVAGVQPRCQIRHRHSHLHRRTVPRARDVHETHFGFDHDVVASARAVGPGLAVACDAGVDQTGIDGVDGGKVHVVFLESVGEVVLHEYVGCFGEGVEYPLTGFRGEGEADGFLVSIDLPETIRIDTLSKRKATRNTYREEIGALSRAFCAFASDVLRKGRTPCSCVVASRRVFNLDDFRTVIGSMRIQLPR